MTSFHALKAVRHFFLSICLLAAAAHAAEEKIQVNLPPSADLQYTIRASVKGLSLSGEGQIQWSGSRNKYRLLYETRTSLLGTLLTESSEGAIDTSGLAPDVFTIKRFRKEPVAVVFDRNTKQVNFTGDVPSYALQGGEQDRLSVLWQLVSMARAAPRRFVPGTSWSSFVLGQRDGENWVFEIKEKQRIRTPAGEFDSLHIVRTSAENSGSPTTELWLAPALDWFPVRLRISEGNGDYIEQSLNKLTHTGTAK